MNLARLFSEVIQIMIKGFFEVRITSQKVSEYLRRFTPSPGNSSIWRAQETAENRRFSQETEDFRRKPQETADWAPSP